MFLQSFKSSSSPSSEKHGTNSPSSTTERSTVGRTIKIKFATDVWVAYYESGFTGSRSIDTRFICVTR